MANDNNINDFIIGLSASMANKEPEQFAKEMCDMASEGDIAEFEAIVDKLVKKKITPELYIKVISPLASELNSLWCFLFNMKFPEEKRERIDNTLRKLNQFRLKWARKQSRQGCDKEVRPLVKYSINGLGRKYYSYFPTKELVEMLIQKGLIYRNPRAKSDTSAFVVRGLHLAVGDNVFTVNWKGQQYRNYVDYCAPEAFYLRPEFQAELKEMDTTSLPELPAYFEIMSIGDYKGCCKISLSSNDKNKIRSFITENRGY